MNEVVLREAFGPMLNFVWGLFLLLAIPLLALAVWKRIFPHLPLLAALLAPLLLSFLVLARDDAILLVLLVDVVIVIIGAIDLLSLPRQKAFTVQRDLLQVASLDKAHAVTLTIANQTRRGWRIWVRDDLPAEFSAVPDQFHLELGRGSQAILPYEFRSRRRGEFFLRKVYLQAVSRWGLWKRFLDYPTGATVHVYPDMQQLSKYALLARTNRLSLIGVRRTRRIGQDNEFERLRDYSRDDNYRHIDWRATARRNKLTVKDFQVNQSQQLIFLVDCGRMMTNEAAGFSLLDHALNSMLMLSYVALRQGDSVGLITFSDQIHSFVPPRGGLRQMNYLLHASFNRFPRLVESRYDEAFLYLASHCRKRSLVVLVTNVIDEVNALQVQQYLRTLVGRHLPVGVLLRDRQLFAAAERPDPEGPELFRAAAAAQIIGWREQVLTDLTHQGVRALDVFPEELTAPLVNQYLEIKARHLL